MDDEIFESISASVATRWKANPHDVDANQMLALVREVNLLKHNATKKQPLWEQHGNVVYRLVESDQFDRGKPREVNEYIIQVSRGHGTTDQDAVELAKRIVVLLNGGRLSAESA